MEKDLLGNVIPLVEKEYRVIKDANHRAIIGYSMGGVQSSTIGLNHPEVFAYVAAMSGNAREAASPRRWPTPRRPTRISSSSGSAAAPTTTPSTAVGRWTRCSRSKGIRHEWVESPGYRHDYQIWRIYLRDLLPKLFRD